MKTKSKSKTIDEKVMEYLKEDAKLLKSVGLAKRMVVFFPKRKEKKTPLFSRIAIFILKIQGAIFDTEFSEIKK